MSDELAPNEAQALADAETTIEQGYAGFLKVGLALANIRDQKLYRATHTTFADYCDQRWHLGKTHAYRLIEAGEVAALLSPMGDIPTTERQARALKTIIDEHGPDVAAKVLDETKSTGTVTATSITEKATELGYGQPATVTTRRSESTTQHVDAVTGEILDPPPGSPPPPSSGPQAPGGVPIVGVNGKTYTRPAPPAHDPATQIAEQAQERAEKFSRDVVFSINCLAPLAAYEDRRDQVETELELDTSIGVTAELIDQAVESLHFIRDTYKETL